MKKQYYVVSCNEWGFFYTESTKAEAIRLRNELKLEGGVNIYIKKKYRNSYLSDYK